MWQISYVRDPTMTEATLDEQCSKPSEFESPRWKSSDKIRKTQTLGLE
jgi:hypothetical protein